MISDQSTGRPRSLRCTKENATGRGLISAETVSNPLRTRSDHDAVAITSSQLMVGEQNDKLTYRCIVISGRLWDGFESVTFVETSMSETTSPPPSTRLVTCDCVLLRGAMDPGDFNAPKPGESLTDKNCPHCGGSGMRQEEILRSHP